PIRSSANLVPDLRNTQCADDEQFIESVCIAAEDLMNKGERLMRPGSSSPWEAATLHHARMSGQACYLVLFFTCSLPASDSAQAFPKIGGHRAADGYLAPADRMPKG